MSVERVLRNCLGAFADGAVLFPLLAALAIQGGQDPVRLLLSAGLAYLAAALVFRVPMSVQPLKSIAIAGLALGAGTSEIRWAGAILGAVCLALTFLDTERLAAKVPDSLVHGIQAGLGILLIWQGAKSLPPGWQAPLPVIGALAAVVLALWVSSRSSFPLLGVVATAGLGIAAFSAGGETSSAIPTAPEGVRGAMLASLVFPQLALTLANSVLGTRNAARRYFGSSAERVTAGRLLASIGAGNLASAAMGGLPYCHGSGGVTAHARGGADHWLAPVVVGVTLLALAAAQAWGGNGLLAYPRPLLAVLLVATGFFHLALARPTWDSAVGRSKLLAMGLAALATRNMLVVLAVGVALEFGYRAWARLGPGARIGAGPGARAGGGASA